MKGMRELREWALPASNEERKGQVSELGEPGSKVWMCSAAAAGCEAREGGGPAGSEHNSSDAEQRPRDSPIPSIFRVSGV